MNTPRQPTADDHEWARQAIPGLVNGTLGGDDQRRLRAHVETCEECRRDLQFDEVLMRSLATRVVVDHPPQASLNKLLQRIDREGAWSPLHWLQSLRDALQVARPGILAAGAAAALILAIAVVWLVSRPGIAPVYTLAAAHEPNVPHLQVIVDEHADVRDVLASLAPMKARVMSGPSSSGVYLIAIEGDGDALTVAARTLQNDSRVRFVAIKQGSPEH